MNLMIAKKLIELRKESGFSQEALAEVLGTSRQAISKWERGEAAPEMENLIGLAKVYDVSIDYIVNYEVEESNINDYIKKILNALQTKDHNIDIEQIKYKISRNKNNFKLLACCGAYLCFRGYELKNNEECSLALEYLLKAVKLSKYNDDPNIKIDEIYHDIINLYIVLEKYHEAIEFIESVRMDGSLIFLGKCYCNIKENDKALECLSKNYLSSVFDIINGGLDTVIILKRKKNYNEALENVIWLINFIESITLGKTSFMNHIHILYLLIKAILEIKLNIDYLPTLKKLTDMFKDKLDNIDETTNSVKFYYGKQETLYSSVKDVTREVNIFFEKLYKDEDFTKEEVDELIINYRRLRNESN